MPGVLWVGLSKWLSCLKKKPCTSLFSFYGNFLGCPENHLTISNLQTHFSTGKVQIHVCRPSSLTTGTSGHTVVFSVKADIPTCIELSDRSWIIEIAINESEETLSGLYVKFMLQDRQIGDLKVRVSELEAQLE